MVARLGTKSASGLVSIRVVAPVEMTGGRPLGSMSVEATEVKVMLAFASPGVVPVSRTKTTRLGSDCEVAFGNLSSFLGILGTCCTGMGAAGTLKECAG